MYILVDKENIIIAISTSLEYQNNIPILRDKNKNKYVIGQIADKIYEVEEIENNIEPYKYCYNPENGFYENENYTEPVPEITNAELLEQITDLQLALAELVEGGLV